MLSAFLFSNSIHNRLSISSPTLDQPDFLLFYIFMNGMPLSSAEYQDHSFKIAKKASDVISNLRQRSKDKFMLLLLQCCSAANKSNRRISHQSIYYSCQPTNYSHQPAYFKIHYTAASSTAFLFLKYFWFDHYSRSETSHLGDLFRLSITSLAESWSNQGKWK